MSGFFNSNTQPLTFGQSNVSSVSGFQIGQPSSSNTGFCFGTSSQPSTIAVNPVAPFGMSSSAAPTSSSTGGLSFGQAASTTPSGLSFGLTSSASGLFGQSSTTPASSSTSGLFGQTQLNVSTSSSPSLNFGATPLTSGTLGQALNAPSSSSTSGFNLGGLGSTSAPTTGLFSLSSTQPTQSTSGLNFGLSTPTTTTPSLGFNFQASTSGSSSGFSLTTASAGLGGSSLLTNTSTSTVSSIGLGGSICSSAATGLGGSSSGLGGPQNTIVDTAGSSNSAKNDNKTAKETPLPQDIFATVSIFESHKDAEKKCSEDNVRQTAAPFHKLVDDTKKLRQHILKLSNQHTQLQASARKLKASVIQEAENVEMARRTQDMPMSLQGNNNAPEQFFLRLVRSFEERMTFCRNKIEEVEKCARNGNGVADISPDDMKEILKKEHNMLKMLAAKIYALRNQLISCIDHSAHPEFQPEALFKIPLKDPPLVSLANKNSSVARPALGEKGSGLLDFQTGQQRAKAVALGASPPTLPLSQSSMPNLLGSTNQSSLFTSPATPAFGGSSNFGFGNSSFNLGSKPPFTPSSGGSLFGNQTLNPNPTGTAFGNQTTSGLFSSQSPTNTQFISNKNFKRF